MPQLNFHLILSPSSLEAPGFEGASSLLQTLFAQHFPNIDLSVRRGGTSRNEPLLDCTLWLSHMNWAEFFRVIRLTKGSLEERRMRVEHTVIAAELPATEWRQMPQGAWVDLEAVPEQWQGSLNEFLHGHEARHVADRWFFLPFSERAPHDDHPGYELCEPGEVGVFGAHTNGSPRDTGIPVGLRIQIPEGARLTDYVASAYRTVLQTDTGLGGGNIILTTLMQMNDRLDLVNHYSERLASPLKLNLLSLPAMNLSFVDERHENDISNLVARGKLIVRGIVLGV